MWKTSVPKMLTLFPFPNWLLSGIFLNSVLFINVWYWQVLLLRNYVIELNFLFINKGRRFFRKCYQIASFNLIFKHERPWKGKKKESSRDNNCLELKIFFTIGKWRTKNIRSSTNCFNNNIFEYRCYRALSISRLFNWAPVVYQKKIYSNQDLIESKIF